MNHFLSYDEPFEQPKMTPRRRNHSGMPNRWASVSYRHDLISIQNANSYKIRILFRTTPSRSVPGRSVRLRRWPEVRTPAWHLRWTTRVWGWSGRGCHRMWWVINQTHIRFIHNFNNRIRNYCAQKGMYHGSKDFMLGILNQSGILPSSNKRPGNANSNECGRWKLSYNKCIYIYIYTLTYRNNIFSRIAIKSVPRGCICKQGTALICNHSNLTEIPKVSPRVNTLYILKTLLIVHIVVIWLDNRSPVYLWRITIWH